MIYYDEKFYNDLDELIRSEIDNPNFPPEGGIITHKCELVPVHEFTPDWMALQIFDHTRGDQWEEFEALKNALSECIDFEKVNATIPKKWSPIGGRTYYSDGDINRLKSSYPNEQ